MPLISDADAIYRGTTPVDAVYAGDVKVWASGPPLTEWRRLTAEVLNSINDPGDGNFRIGTSNVSQRKICGMGYAHRAPVDMDGKPLWKYDNGSYYPADDWFKLNEQVGFWHTQSGSMLLTRLVDEWDFNEEIFSIRYGYFRVDSEWGNPVPFVNGDEYLIGRVA